MKKATEENKRRDFLKKCGLSTVPFLLPTIGLEAMTLSSDKIKKPHNDETIVNFIYDLLPEPGGSYSLIY